MSKSRKPIQTALNKNQYIGFLQFCKKNNITKYECARLSIISYCKIKAPDHFLNNPKSLDDELKELLEQ